MAYFSIGMALHSEGSYEDVLSLLSDGLAWCSGEEPPPLPSKSAIFQARARLGSEPLRALFAKVAVPLARADTPGAFLGGRRLVAIDGTCLDVADTPDNAAHFGRPGVNKGEQAAFPQARLVAVAECGTHAIFDAVVGTYATAENTLAGELIERLGPKTLLLCDGASVDSRCGPRPFRPAATCCGGPNPPWHRVSSRRWPTVPSWPSFGRREVPDARPSRS
jgi:hypothetical protein